MLISSEHEKVLGAMLLLCRLILKDAAIFGRFTSYVDWLQSLKHFFTNVSYLILVASLTLMALYRAIRVRLATSV